MGRSPLAAALALTALACLVPAPAAGEDPPPPPPPPAEGAPPAPPPPATTPVTKGSFSVSLDLKGVFDAREPAEVQFIPLVYGGELEVVEAAAPGPVEKGQVLVRFKTEKIDEQIRNAEASLAVARAAFKRQTEDFARQGEAGAIALARAERDSRDADLSLKNFREIEIPLRTAESANSLQWTKDRMEDQVEEIAQLEKMYKADDLVEETEDIVMKRARRGLERTRVGLGFQTQRDALLREVELPRQLENLTLNQRKNANDRDRAQATTAIALEVSRLELERARLSLSQQEEQFERLGRDRAALTLTAPAAGTAVPGSLVRGKWTDMDQVARDLRPGRRLRANQVIFTILQPGAVQVATTVPEASLFGVAEGQEAKVTPNAAPELKLKARVARVARVSTGSEFEVVLELQDGDPRLMPGHTCKAKLTTTEKPDALTLPAAAVAEEGEKRFVHAMVDGAPLKREVVTGATSGGRVEILSGAAEGDLVLASPPKAK